MYFRFFSLSQKKTNYFLTYHTWKMSPHYLVKCTTSSFDWRYVAQHSSTRWWLWKKAGCGLASVALKRTGCDVWQMECQTSNVTANVQSDCTDTCFQSQRFRNSSMLRIGTQYAWKNEKKKNLCILQGSAVIFFRCGGFFWDNVNNLKYIWIILLKMTFGFPKVKWLQYTGEVGKCTISYWCQIFSGFNTQKSSKSFTFWQNYLKK